MIDLLYLLKRARKIAQRRYPEGLVIHYLLSSGKVLEVILPLG